MVGLGGLRGLSNLNDSVILIGILTLHGERGKSPLNNVTRIFCVCFLFPSTLQSPVKLTLKSFCCIVVVISWSFSQVHTWKRKSMLPKLERLPVMMPLMALNPISHVTPASAELEISPQTVH